MTESGIINVSGPLLLKLYRKAFFPMVMRPSFKDSVLRTNDANDDSPSEVTELGSKTSLMSVL